MNVRLYLYSILRRFFLPDNYCSEALVKSLKGKGCKIGENVKFFHPETNFIDSTRPYLLEIRDCAKITYGCIILTHDFSFSVFRHVFHDNMNECTGKTIIGRNNFIGMGSIIMPGVKLGDNVIVGSGSVVTKSFPDDVVIAGNPAKVICTLDELYKRRKERFLTDAVTQARIIRQTYNREPTIKEMEGFYALFLPRNLEILKSTGISVKRSGDYEDEILHDFMESSPMFSSFQEFLDETYHYKSEEDK